MLVRAMDRVIKVVVFYQIHDDYLNFSAYASQKGFAEDMDEGKFSFPIVALRSILSFGVKSSSSLDSAQPARPLRLSRCPGRSRII